MSLRLSSGAEQRLQEIRNGTPAIQRAFLLLLRILPEEEVERFLNHGFVRVKPERNPKLFGLMNGNGNFRDRLGYMNTYSQNSVFEIHAPEAHRAGNVYRVLMREPHLRDYCVHAQHYYEGGWKNVPGMDEIVAFYLGIRYNFPEFVRTAVPI